MARKRKNPNSPSTTEPMSNDWSARTIHPTIAPCESALQVCVAVYLLLVGTSALNFWRSVAFALGGIGALYLLTASMRRLGPRISAPGSAVPVTLGLWCLWGCLSLLWSVDPAYTAHQLKREVGYSLVVIVTFYVAGTIRGAWPLLLWAAVGGYSLVAAVALGMGISPVGWNAGLWHAGVGEYSTYSVLIVPLLMLILAPQPVGLGRAPLPMLLATVTLVLLVVTNLQTYNRLVWLALAAICVTIAALAASRWRTTVAVRPGRWLALLLVLLLGLTVVFVTVVRQKSQLLFPGQTTLTTITSDVRLPLWEYTFFKIRERPWTGYGFGKLILEGEMRSALGNPLLTHGHNVLLNQWLQLGAIGAAAFAALLAALACRFARLARSRDDTLAIAGIAGLALLVGFVVKNLTDDFLLQSNAKEFWAFAAMLLGFCSQREQYLNVNRANM